MPGRGAGGDTAALGTEFSAGADGTVVSPIGDAGAI
jgi:hypothetical protein